MEVPPENAPAAASVCGSSAALAVTLIAPSDWRLEPLRTEASVSNLMTTLTATEPAMPTSPLPPAAAAPQAMKSSVFEAGVTASMVMPLPWMSEPPPSTNALLVTLTTLTETPAPMLSSLSMASAAPTASAFASSSACAEIFTAPLASTSAPWVTLAVLSALTKLTETAAATPTLVPLLPPSELLELFWLSALSLPDGSAVLLPLLVFALPLTCLSAWPSAPLLLPSLPSCCESSLSSPFTVAMACASLDTADTDESVKSPPLVVMLRASSALTSSITTATLTEAPTPTLLLAASALVEVSYRPWWAAVIDTSPLAEMVPVPVPTYAVTSSSTTATATPMPTAVLPVAPFSPCVKA